MDNKNRFSALAWNPLKAHPIQRKSGKLADLNLPLHKAVCVGVAVHAEEKEPLALFVVAVVGVQYFPDLGHDFGWVATGRRLHRPREAQRSRLYVLVILAASSHNAFTKEIKTKPYKITIYVYNCRHSFIGDLWYSSY